MRTAEENEFKREYVDTNNMKFLMIEGTNGQVTIVNLTKEALEVELLRKELKKP